MDTVRGGRCAACRRTGPDVAPRGRFADRGRWCDGCWARHVNTLAEKEGAIDTPWPDPGPDDTTWPAPPTCGDCEVRVVPRRTDYDRWVHLDHREHPAHEVPPRHRWLLRPDKVPHTAVVVEYVAVPAGRTGPVPDRVHCAHRAVCPARHPQR